MQLLKFIRTLSLARNNLLRAGRANGGSAQQLTKKVIIGTGATGKTYSFRPVRVMIQIGDLFSKITFTLVDLLANLQMENDIPYATKKMELSS
uniref:Uncharacterized protein n=1 Tax=Rhabditophanes sp. KR3021 TaxID=114890 RepID=A0AC35TV32_9BILA